MCARQCDLAIASLGEYVASLSAGDSCPCCGGTLSRNTSVRGAGLLGCPACGCELEEEDTGAQSMARGDLVRAA